MSMVALLSAIFPVTLKCASLRLDCCGLASPSFALGGASGVGTPHPAARAATNTVRSDRRSDSLTLHHLRGRRCGYRFPGVVLVKGQGQRIGSLVARLGDLILERVPVAFANPAVALVAILVLGFGVPGFAVGQAFLADVREVRGTGEAVRPEACAGLLRGPLAVPGCDERVVDAVDGNVLVADLRTRHRRLHLQSSSDGRLVNQRTIAVDIDGRSPGSRTDELAAHREMGVL